MEEAELIRKAQRGELGAFEELLFKYEKEIFRHLARHTSRREDAEDLTQETFIKFYRSLSRLEPEQGARAWLYKIATNALYDWLRKKKNFLPIKDAETIAAPHAYYEIEAARGLKEALSGLRPAERSTLLLFYEEGLKYREIAEALDLPLNTVKTRLSRAKAALKKELEKNHE